MIERPFVVFCLNLYFGMFFAAMIFSHYYMFAAFAAIFFVISILLCKKIYIIPAIMFFLIGISSVLIYYNFHVSNRETIRIKYSSSSYIIGEVNRRRTYIRGNVKDLKSGDIILAEGSFYEHINYEKGNLGYYYIESFKKENDFISNIYNYKENIYDNLKNNLGNENSSLIMAMVFGDKERVDEYKNEEYKEYGISHILCVSGFNISLAFYILQGLFGTMTAIAGSLIYLILVGGNSQAVRSLIMIMISFFGKRLNKHYDSLSSLSFAFIIIILFSPYLIFDLGTIISFLSVLGIILFNGKINKRLYYLPSSVCNIISLSLASQVFTLPIIGYIFGKINLSFLLGNLILVPILTLIIYLSLPLILTVNFKVFFNFNCEILKISFYILKGGETIAEKLVIGEADVSKYFLISILLMIIFIIISKRYIILRRLYIPLILIFYLGRYSILPVLISTDNLYIIKSGFNTYLISDYYINNDKDIIKAKLEYSPNVIYTNIGLNKSITSNRHIFKFEKYKGKLKLGVYYNNIKIGEFLSGENGKYSFLYNKIVR